MKNQLYLETINSFVDTLLSIKELDKELQEVWGIHFSNSANHPNENTGEVSRQAMEFINKRAESLGLIEGEVWRRMDMFHRQVMSPKNKVTEEND